MACCSECAQGQSCTSKRFPFPGPETIQLFRQPQIHIPAEGEQLDTWVRGVEFGFEVQRFEWDRLVVMLGAAAGFYFFLTALGR